MINKKNTFTNIYNVGY